MAVPPESVLESDIDTEMSNSMIGAKAVGEGLILRIDY